MEKVLAHQLERKISIQIKAWHWFRKDKNNLRAQSCQENILVKI